MKEQTFFADPAIDKIMATVLALAAELHIARTRQRALESILVNANLIAPEAVSTWQPDPAAQQDAAEDLAVMVRNLFTPLLATAPGSLAKPSKA